MLAIRSQVKVVDEAERPCAQDDGELPECSGHACTSPLRFFAESVSLCVSSDCLQLLKTSSGFTTAEPLGTTQTPTSELCTVSLGDATSPTTRVK